VGDQAGAVAEFEAALRIDPGYEKARQVANQANLA